MKKYYNIIDGNAIGYSAQGTMKLTSGGMQTQAAFGFLRTMREMRLKFPKHTPIVLWDGKTNWRFKLHPLYKSNRSSDAKKIAEREAYALMRPYIQRALTHLGVKQITVSTHEADDMAGYLVRTLSADPKNEIMLSTGDQDWLQLVRKNVCWRDNRDDDKFIDADNFYSKTGCLTPFAFLECKILHGDTSDVISGVGGIGKAGAPEFIAQFGSVREFWRQCDSGEYVVQTAAQRRLWKGISPYTKEEWVAQQVLTAEVRTEKDELKLKKQWADSWEGQGRLLYKRNFQLMQLLKVTPPLKSNMNVDLGKRDDEAFANICEELAFISILRNVDEFTNLFKK